MHTPRSDDGSILLATLDHPHDAPELLILIEFPNEGYEGQRRSPIRYIGERESCRIGILYSELGIIQRWLQTKTAAQARLL